MERESAARNKSINRIVISFFGFMFGWTLAYPAGLAAATWSNYLTGLLLAAVWSLLVHAITSL